MRTAFGYVAAGVCYFMEAMLTVSRQSVFVVSLIFSIWFGLTVETSFYHPAFAQVVYSK